jgi:hypothetical protein
VELTLEQKRTFAAQGYLPLPGIVPREKVEAALRAINHSLGFRGLPPEKLTEYSARSYCPELQGDPVITDLLHATPLWSVAESLIGPGKIRPVRSGQIALRFPRPDPRMPPPHLDGMYTPTNGVPQGTIANFTALVGVFLSDLPGPNAGNFTVWPGTHLLYEQYFRRHGPQSLLQGMPPVELPEPVQITGRAGDAVLCHYQLAHTANGNGSPHIRYAVFFRLSHVDHERHHWDCMTDIWLEWEGMRDVVGERAAVG